MHFVHFIRFPSNANDAISLVAAGQADIGLYYQQDVIQVRAQQDVPVKSIGAVVQGPLNIVLSLEEKGITSAEDLVGKTIGYAGTELSEALIRSIMQYVGADYSDVTMIDVGFDLMSSMTTGNVDATIGCLVNHEVPQMEEEGFSVNWFDLDDYGVPTYYEGIFLASDEAIANDSETLQAFLRASAKGFADMKADPEAALATLLTLTWKPALVAMLLAGHLYTVFIVIYYYSKSSTRSVKDETLIDGQFFVLWALSALAAYW